jgi:hypothetical protein
MNEQKATERKSRVRAVLFSPEFLLALIGGVFASYPYLAVLVVDLVPGNRPRDHTLYLLLLDAFFFGLGAFGGAVCGLIIRLALMLLRVIVRIFLRSAFGDGSRNHHS